jgi:hypothetical protein
MMGERGGGETTFAGSFFYSAKSILLRSQRCNSRAWKCLVLHHLRCMTVGNIPTLTTSLLTKCLASTCPTPYVPNNECP